MRYLEGTKDLGIAYFKGQPDCVVGYSDADFAGDQKDSKSTTGYVFKYANEPIAWRSRKQQINTTSSTEAELVSLYATMKEATWLSSLSTELNITNGQAITINSDNTITIKIASNERAAGRTKHLTAQRFYYKEQVEKGIIDLKHVPSLEQQADFLTKPLGPQGFKNNCLMHSIFIMATIMCLTTSSLAKFQTSAPNLYRRVDTFVESATTEYNLEITYVSPCLAMQDLDDTF